MEFKELAAKIGFVYQEKRLGYHLTNNPNALMKNGVQFVTIHQTGNPTVGAGAANHHNYLRNGSGGEKKSWHWNVDETGGIQSFRDTRVLWHSYNTQGNAESVSMELAIDADVKGGSIMGETNYKKTIDNGAKLAAILLTLYGKGSDKLRQHYDWSKKNCPAQIRAGLYGIKWADFVALTEKYMAALKPEPVKIPEPVKALTAAPDGKLWRVAVDSFKYRENAQDLIDQLKDDGYINSFLIVIEDPR